MKIRFPLIRIQLICLLLLMLCACRQAQVPVTYSDSQELPAIYPDYVGVTIPVNMAPLRFEVM